MEVRNIMAAAACATSLTFSAAAAAQTTTARTGTMSDTLTASTYVGGAIGGSDYNVACVGPFACDRESTAGKVFVGSKLNDRIGVELSYVHMGEVQLGGGGDSRAHGLNASFVAGIPVSQNFTINGKIGTTYGWTRIDGPAAFGGGEDDGFGLSYGAGLNYLVTRNVEVRLDWDRHDFKFTRGNDTVDLYTVGVAYRFR